MHRKLPILAVAAGLLLAPTARGQPVSVLPGVTYSHVLRFTPHGPVSMHVVIAPRPGGLYALQPVLSQGLVTGRETVSAMERDLAPQATSIGVNGDLFNWVDGYPTGIFMQGGVLEHHPDSGRSSIGVDAAGMLHVARVALFGTWRGAGARHPFGGVNEPVRRNQLGLFTPAWGPATPKAGPTLEVVLSAFPPATPGVDLVGTVAAVARGGGTPIPVGGAVLVARGSAAAALAAEAPLGATVTVRLTLKGWAGVVDALGGGPVLVRSGKPVFRAYEAFTPSQVIGRDPRTAVGQRANGQIVLVAVDGRQPGWSVGITNFELAQTLVSLGCVTGSALDSGGSTTVAFDGVVLNRPSDPWGERPVSEALLVTYAGVFARPLPLLSPNGDGVDEREALSYKIVRPSTVSAQLVAPDGAARDVDSGAKPAGTYSFPWSGRAPDGTPEPEGRWHWRVSATDDLGRLSTIDRAFSLNTTLAALSVRPAGGRARTIAFTLAHAAAYRVTVETRAGETLKTVAVGRAEAGRVAVRWGGRDGKGRVVPSGSYVVHIAATNELGLAALRTPLRIP